MGIFSSLFRMAPPQEAIMLRESVPGVPESTMPSESPTPGSGSYEENIVVPNRYHAALTISAFHRAVELRAKTVAQFEPQFQRMNYEGGNYMCDMKGYGRRLNYLLQIEPNPLMTASTFWQQMSINRMMLGNAYAYLERNEFGDVVRIWFAGYGSYNSAAGTYTLTFATDKGIANCVEVPASDVLHWPNTFREPNGYLGIPTITYIINTLSLIATEKRQALETAAKGGRMKLIIGEDPDGTVGAISKGLFDKAKMDDYAKEIEQKLYRNDVLAMRALKTVQNISMSAQDQQMVELLRISEDNIAQFTGTPRSLLMLDTNSHYTTYRDATMEYLTRTVAPDVDELEQEVSRKMIGFDGYGTFRFRMCDVPLLRLDKEAQAKVDEMRMKTGSATTNEIRKQYDLPSVKGGDIVYISTNLAELGSEKLRGSAGGAKSRETETND